MKSGRIVLPVFVSALALLGCGEGGGGGEAAEDATGPGAGSGGGRATGAGGSASNTGGSGSVVKPPEIPSAFEPGDCGLDAPAFCDDFEKTSPGGRGGDLDERNWAFARWGHENQFFIKPTAYGSPPGISQLNTPTFCGVAIPAAGIDDPDDVRICQGVNIDGESTNQLNEILNDAEGFGLNELRIRQPFDFTDRTGTLVFDVDAKHNDDFAGNTGHGWWLELWITEDPVPIPYHGSPTVGSYPRSGLGFQFLPMGCGFTDGKNEISRVVVTEDSELVRDEYAGQDNCFSAADDKPNRFKLMISTHHVEIWAGDFDGGGELRKVFETELDLKFSYGYVHFQHSQYNANKEAPVAGSSPSQTYRWDNIGFDGPAYPVPRSYDVPDMLEPTALGRRTGYPLDNSAAHVKVTDVDKSSALRATFNFGIVGASGESLRFRFNGNGWHTATVPSKFSPDEGPLLRTFSVEIPLDEIVDGDNTIDVENINLSAPTAIGNMDLTIDVTN